jgi:hypothetical protein
MLRHWGSPSQSFGGTLNIFERIKQKHMLWVIMYIYIYNSNDQWEFQDPKMEVLYHIRPYFVDIPLHRPDKIGLIYGRYLQSRILKWPLK